MTYKLTNTSQPADPYYGAVSLLLHGNGANNSTDIRDSSLNTKAITVHGTAKISTAQSKWNGSSLEFDGTNITALTVPTSSDFDFGGNDFTVELWYWRGGTQFYGRIFVTRNGDFPSGVALFHNLGDSSSLYLQMSVNGSTVFVDAPINAGLVLASWNHIAVTRNGSSVIVFVNGSSVYSVNIGSSILYYNSANTVCVGGQTLSISRSIYGYINDLRVTKGVARYTSNFTPPTQPFFNV